MASTATTETGISHRTARYICALRRVQDIERSRPTSKKAPASESPGLLTNK